MKNFALGLALSVSLFALPALAADPQHGVAIHGQPKYAAGFEHFDYVNVDAPKGGTLRLGSLGTFDSLNPFIVKGTPAAQTGLVYETLLTSSSDEPFTEYGLIAQTIEMPEDRSSVTFNLRPEAKWSDGQPITASDVVWSFRTLAAKGAPFYRAYYANVKDVVAENPARVTFTFDIKGNMELPLIVGQLPILPEHYWKDKTFENSTLVPPIGSGPYVFGNVDAGRSITYKRNPDWWGKDLPVNKGRYNFDTIAVDYYRDSGVALEAFFAGRIDVRSENVAKLWATAYTAPAVKDGRIVKEEIKNGLPAGMQGFIMNTRRPVFKDRAVREAIQYAFDFEWSNKALAHGAYKRTASYFENSEMASKGVPEGKELEILEPFRNQLPPEVFTTAYENPTTDGTGNTRANLKKASDILDAAGYKLGEDGIRAKDGVKLVFEIADNQPEFERWALPFIKNLQRIGIKASFRVLDTAQYINRMNDFDFDMTIGGFGQSLSPGNEQRDYWTSSKADEKGSRNIIGIKNPVVDKLVDLVITAPTREDLVIRARALDRVLLWNYYVIPQYYTDLWKIAHWSKIEKPAKPAAYDPGIVDTWWMKPTRP